MSHISVAINKRPTQMVGSKVARRGLSDPVLIPQLSITAEAT